MEKTIRLILLSNVVFLFYINNLHFTEYKLIVLLVSVSAVL